MSPGPRSLTSRARNRARQVPPRPDRRTRRPDIGKGFNLAIGQLYSAFFFENGPPDAHGPRGLPEDPRHHPADNGSGSSNTRFLRELLGGRRLPRLGFEVTVRQDLCPRHRTSGARWPRRRRGMTKAGVDPRGSAHSAATIRPARRRDNTESTRRRIPATIEAMATPRPDQRRHTGKAAPHRCSPPPARRPRPSGTAPPRLRPICPELSKLSTTEAARNPAAASNAPARNRPPAPAESRSRYLRGPPPRTASRRRAR